MSPNSVQLLDLYQRQRRLIRQNSLMVRSVPIPPRGRMAPDNTHELRAAIRQAAVIQRLIRRHLARITRRPAAGASLHDNERTMQVKSDLLVTLDQNTQALQRALAFGRGHRVLH